MKNKIFTIFLAIILIVLVIITTYLRLNDNSKQFLSGEKVREISSSLDETKISSTSLTLDDIVGVIEDETFESDKILEESFITKESSIYDKSRIIAPNKDTKYLIDESGRIVLMDGNFDNFEYLIENVSFNISSYELNISLKMYALDFDSKTTIKNSNFKAFYGNEELPLLSKERRYDITSDVVDISLTYKCNEEIDLKDFNIQYFVLKYIDELNIKENNIY